MKFVAHASYMRLAAERQPTPQTYTQAATTQQLQAKQNYYSATYGEQNHGAEKLVKAYVAWYR